MTDWLVHLHDDPNRDGTPGLPAKPSMTVPSDADGGPPPVLEVPVRLPGDPLAQATINRYQLIRIEHVLDAHQAHYVLVEQRAG